MRWVIDGNNVMGAAADGWWNDRVAAAARLTDRIARWCWTHDDEVLVVFDGAEQPAVAARAGGNLEVGFAPRGGRDAADHVIVQRVAELYVDPDLTVVTSDRGLIDRLPPGVATEGSGAFLHRLPRR